MACLNSRCNIAGEDRMVSCWLCRGNYHLKCASLKARDADALADPGKCLQWCCPQCKKINVEFYKFFKSFNDEYDNLYKDYLNLQSKLSKFGELFNNYSNLDKFIDMKDLSSPNISTQSNKSPVLPPILHSSVMTRAKSAEITNEIPASDSTSPQPISNNNIPVINIDNVSTFPPQMSHLSNSSNTTVENQIVRNPLTAVPPKRSIFVSRLANSTASEDVEFYIKSKVGCNADVLIHKFQYSQPRSITSFKLTLSDELFNQVVDKNFWPVNTLVREYIYQNRNNHNNYNNVGVLLQRESNSSKN